MEEEERHRTDELRTLEAERERVERERARQATTPDEAHAAERRAERAAYLREKLDEQARSQER